MPSAYLITGQPSSLSRILVTVTAAIVALLAAWTIISILMSNYFVTKAPADIKVLSQPQQSIPDDPLPTPVVRAPPEVAPPLAEPVVVGSFPPTVTAAFAEAPDIPVAPKAREIKTLLDEIRIDPVGPVPLPPQRPRTTDASSVAGVPMPRPRPDLGEPEFVLEPYIARMQ